MCDCLSNVSKIGGKNMSRYVATIDTKWEDFTEKHKEIREEVEEKSKDFLEGKRPNPIAIRGPIGQGKTQLLYHIFEFVWRNGGMAFYTTLDKILPEKETTASDFAQQLDFGINQSVEKLKAGQIEEVPFFTKELIQFVKNSKKNIYEGEKVVFLIDEMERSYGKLLNKVKTDDRSPFGYWLEHTACFPIAAFTPLSHYEALYGEAEKRRWDSMQLPPITATVLRLKDKDFGNFVWWVSRGRLGISYKAMVSVKRKKFTDFKEFEELVSELGPIAGVPAIDLDNLAKLTKSFPSVIKLFPQSQVTLPSVMEGELVTKAEFIDLLKVSLGNEEWRERSIEFFAYYFNIVMEALSQNGGILLPLERYEEILALFKLGVDLAIEHETLEHDDAKYIFEKFHEIEEKFPSFFFKRLYRQLEKLSKGKGSVLSYREITNLFPMPITSPVFGDFDTADKAKEILLSDASYDYVAKDEIETTRGLTTFLYFPNEVRIRHYLNSQEIMNFLPPNKGLICILLDGDPLEISVQDVAAWLREVGRLTIELPSKMLRNFLTCFMAWVFNKRIADGYINNLRNILDEQTEALWSKDKESSRKVSHYRSMLETFLGSFKDTLLFDKEKYSAKASKDIIRRYGGRYTRFPDLVGVAFVERREERNLIYRFRKLLLDSDELKSLRSGIGGLLEDTSVTRRGFSTGLENIRNDFNRELHLLLALAHERQVQEEDFVTLSEQTEARTALRGIYTFARSNMPFSRLAEIKKEINGTLKEIEKLKQARKNIIQDVGLSVRESRSQKNQTQIKELQKIISDAENSSQYTRWLLVEFAIAILIDFKNQYLHPDQTILSKWETRSDTAKSFTIKREDIDKLKRETLDWLGKKRDEVNDELNADYKEALETLTRYDREVNWENVDVLEWSSFGEKIDTLVDQVEILKEIDSKLQGVLQVANEINDQLKKRV